MSHVHGLKKPKPRPTRPTRPRCRVQPEGPVLKDHLLATSATSEPTDPRCGKDGGLPAPRLKRQFWRKYLNKIVVTSGSMFFWGCYGNGKQSSVWLASPQYANTYQYLASLFAEFPIHTTTPYSWWFPCLRWRGSDHFLRQHGCFRPKCFGVPWGPIGFFDQPMGLFMQWGHQPITAIQPMAWMFVWLPCHPTNVWVNLTSPLVSTGVTIPDGKYTNISKP